MRIAVLSDTRLPTAASFPGHGLGKLALSLANGLKARGHDVTLFAGKGSAFDGEIQLFDDENDYVRATLNFDAMLDITHFHKLQYATGVKATRIVNVSVDREASPGRCAVFPSEHHRKIHQYTPERARVIPHGVDMPTLKGIKKGTYYAYLSMFHGPKGPTMAAEAARLAGVELVMAGPTPPVPPPGTRYIGPIFGEEKMYFLAEAQALIYPASTESAGLVPLEAQAVGTPALVSAYGGAPEQIIDGKTGLTARDTLEMGERIKMCDALKADDCKTFVREQRSMAGMIDAYEKALMDVANGVSW